MLRSVVAGAGGDPDRVRETTIGFEAVKALLARRVAGATAFWNVEGVALREKRPDIREFRVDDYGAPAYPELVLTVTRETLEDHPSLVRATIRALQRGYTQTQNDPESAVSTMLEPRAGPRARGARRPARRRRAGLHGRRGRVRRSCGRRGCVSGRRGTRASGS